MAVSSESSEQLDNLRHSCAHLLAAAVVELWPNAKPTIGPPIKDGFYYDFEFPTAIGEEDLPRIEEKMKEIATTWESMDEHAVSKEEARKEFSGNPYKLELIDDIDDEQITIYQSGNFRDLCRGGHSKNPNQDLKHFKLLSIAGAYWKGNQKNKMLTRIYGTCFPSQEELTEYLNKIEEAKCRDHRKIGKEMDLFVFSDLVGSGFPLFTPKGTVIRNMLIDYINQLQSAQEYKQVTIPHLTKKELYETSGHWDKYRENMFRVTREDKESFALKPMNCPHHTQIFASRPKSYKDLPQRYSEVTSCYRSEKSGELLGLSCVQMLTQDDAHVFCTEEQAIDECLLMYKLISTFYETVGMGIDCKVRISLRDPDTPEKYLGSDEQWNKSEQMLREVANKAGHEVVDGVGEAAFYAPKLDFLVCDALGREWQLGTIQLDFILPERFNLEYTDKDGSKKRPVMIHRAVMGSLERFMSILIEHFAGNFPVWLSPVQAVILPINDRVLDYAQDVKRLISDQLIRTELNDRDETLNSKIRDAQLQKVPYMIIVGEKEKESNTISIRDRTGKEENNIETNKFIERVRARIEKRSQDL